MGGAIKICKTKPAECSKAAKTLGQPQIPKQAFQSRQ